LWSEPPVIRWKCMHVQVKRTRDQHSTIGPEHAIDLIEATPEALHVLECGQSDDGADRAIRQWKGFNVADDVHTGPGAAVKPVIGLARKERAQISKGFLASNLECADLDDGRGQIESFGNGADHAMEKGIHRFRFKFMNPSRTAQSEVEYHDCLR